MPGRSEVFHSRGPSFAWLSPLAAGIEAPRSGVVDCIRCRGLQAESSGFARAWMRGWCQHLTAALERERV